MHRIVILRGSQGRGRTATAVRLLQTVSVATVYELDPATDLQELAELLESSGSSDRQLAQGDAFLLGAPPDFGRVTGFALRALEAPLRDIGGRLVIVVGQDVILVDDEVRQYVVDLIGEPPARAVFDSHLR